MPAPANAAKKVINSAPKNQRGGGGAAAVKAGKKPAADAAAAKPKKVIRVSQRKQYTRPQFRRPHTNRRARANRPDSNCKVVKSSWDEFRIIKSPLNTDTAMKKLEENNTLTFLCDPRATKTSIKRAVAALYKVKIVKVNTLIRPDGAKKAYVRLPPSQDAMDVAQKIGILN